MSLALNLSTVSRFAAKEGLAPAQLAQPKQAEARVDALKKIDVKLPESVNQRAATAPQGGHASVKTVSITAAELLGALEPGHRAELPEVVKALASLGDTPFKISVGQESGPLALNLGQVMAMVAQKFEPPASAQAADSAALKAESIDLGAALGTVGPDQTFTAHA